MADEPEISEEGKLPNNHISSLATFTQVNQDAYWKRPLNSQSTKKNDLVVIHVCDENQNITRDFCCERNILINNMKYFQKFLSENENGYDDIDISVHCDVEIFEWLMAYIHDEKPSSLKIDKSIIVSILISSEFLQMEKLVELCVEQVATNLNDIIKLPIDLSCISEKLINRIAALTHPKTLTEIRDRKDKILTKLYKRRVEVDFSRKGSAVRNNTTNTPTTHQQQQLQQQASRTIAASLTCCRFCGSVYLENYAYSLTCRKAPPSIDARGCIASRHSAIQGWSLTSYLKTLHAGGMGWDAIYWHVWAACVVVRAGEITISALEADRYSIEPDGLVLKPRPVDNMEELLLDSNMTVNKDNNNNNITNNKTNYTSALSSLTLNTTSNMNMNSLLFNLAWSTEEIQALHHHYTIQDATSTKNSSNPSTGSILATMQQGQRKLSVTYKYDHLFNTTAWTTTSSLNPQRPPELLTPEIFDLVCSQMRHIVSLSHRTLINATMQTMIDSAGKSEAITWMISSSSKAPIQSSNSSVNTTTTSNNNSNSNSSSVNSNLQQRLSVGFNELFWGSSVRITGSTQDEIDRRRGRSLRRQTVRGSSSDTGNRLSSKSANAAMVKNKSSNALPPSGSTGISTSTISGNGSVGIADSDGNNNNNTDSNNTDNTTTNNNDNNDGNNNNSNSRKGVVSQERRSRSASVGKRTGSNPPKPKPTSEKKLSVTDGGSGGNNPNSSNSTTTDIDDSNYTSEEDAPKVSTPIIISSKPTQPAPRQVKVIDPLIVKYMDILKSLPVNLHQRVIFYKAPVFGVWLQSVSPLQTFPPALYDSLQVVSDQTHLSDAKKIEWELDLMREYDERIMDRLERWLITNRQENSVTTEYYLAAVQRVKANSSIKGAGNLPINGNKVTKQIDYYKDKGRQAYRIVN